jgi:hypothetical protein
MSEFEEAREAFRVRWGFDPAPVIADAIRAGEFDVAGGDEDTRAFVREALTATAGHPAQGADDEPPIGMACPECGEPPRMVLPGGNQAFCGNTSGCRILMWDPTQTRAEMAAEGVREIDLSGWPGGGGSGD